MYRDDGRDGLSLKYSLRSIDKFGKGIDRVFLVGDKPSWVSDRVTYISCTDSPYGSKGFNIFRKIKCAVDNSDISEEILVSMDDHFYRESVDFDHYPYYVKNSALGILLPDSVGGYTNKAYASCLILTRKLLEEMKLSFLNFTLHRNMHLTRRVVTEVWPHLLRVQSLPVEGLAFALNYQFSQKKFEYVPVSDCKIANPQLISGNVFSTIDFEEGSSLDKWLLEQFPEKSKYEDAEVHPLPFSGRGEGKLSIIVSAYNAESSLARCLTSIRNIDITDWECIVVDDGSSDNTGVLAQNFQAIDSRFKVIANLKNQGVGKSRNLALSKITGDWVGFIDSDDWVEPDRFSRALNAAVKMGYSVVQCGMQVQYPNSQVVWSCPLGEYEIRDRRILSSNTYDIGHCINKIYQSSIFSDIRFAECNFCEDLLMNIQVYAKETKLLSIGGNSYHYSRSNPDSLSSREISEAELEAFYREYKRVFLKLRGDNSINPDFVDQADKFIRKVFSRRGYDIV